MPRGFLMIPLPEGGREVVSRLSMRKRWSLVEVIVDLADRQQQEGLRRAWNAYGVQEDISFVSHETLRSRSLALGGGRVQETWFEQDSSVARDLGRWIGPVCDGSVVSVRARDLTSTAEWIIRDLDEARAAPDGAIIFGSDHQVRTIALAQRSIFGSCVVNVASRSLAEGVDVATADVIEAVDYASRLLGNARPRLVRHRIPVGSRLRAETRVAPWAGVLVVATRRLSRRGSETSTSPPPLKWLRSVALADAAALLMQREHED
jgi:hypothetical protein